MDGEVEIAKVCALCSHRKRVNAKALRCMHPKWAGTSTKIVRQSPRMCGEAGKKWELRAGATEDEMEYARFVAIMLRPRP